jgi:hypothetical protein
MTRGFPHQGKDASDRGDQAGSSTGRARCESSSEASVFSSSPSAAVSVATELQQRIAGPFTLTCQVGQGKDSLRLTIRAEGGRTQTPEVL